MGMKFEQTTGGSEEALWVIVIVSQRCQPTAKIAHPLWTPPRAWKQKVEKQVYGTVVSNQHGRKKVSYGCVGETGKRRLLSDGEEEQAVTQRGWHKIRG
jgi:hypothetical protein